MGVDPYLIAPTLILGMAQRLVPKIADECRVQVPYDGLTNMMLEKQFADLPEEFKKNIDFTKQFSDVKGTKDIPLGTRGRLAVLETLSITKEIERVILNGAQEPEIYKVARAQGMITMKEDAMIKSTQGLVPVREAYNL